MQLSDVSRESGLPIATIKYYMRECLVPAGEAVAPNRARYSDAHVRRLRLIRALAQLGDLPLDAIREVLTAIDDEGMTLHDTLGVAHHALARQDSTNEGSPELDAARADVDSFLSSLRWRVKDDAPDRDELAAALLTLQRLGWDVDVGVLSRYAKAADRLAAWELKQIPTGEPRERTVEAVVIGTVVFGSVLSALRRLAEEHHSASRFG